MNHIQQLRKAAGLDLGDVVEVFFQENDTVVQDAVTRNVAMFQAKFKSVPLSQAPAATTVVLKSETVNVGGSNVTIYVCRPALAPRDDLDPLAVNYLSTLDPSATGTSISFTIDGNRYALEENKDYFFQVLPEEFVIEKSPSYFYNSPTPERIYNMDKDVKLLLIVKDPIERCFV